MRADWSSNTARLNLLNGCRVFELKMGYKGEIGDGANYGIES
jgi:hypothetical protein